jgi:outer membrane receptor protein involved in Fe transport
MTDDFHLYGLEINYDFGWAQITSATSYVDREITNDRDGTTLAALVVPPPLQFAPLKNPLKYYGYTQELRLASPDEGAWRWQVGGFYSSGIKHFSQLFPVEGSDASLATIGIPPAADFGAEPDDLFHSHLDFDERQLAFFGELSYAFLDNRWIATVGGRWFDYKLDYHVDAAGLFNGGVTSGEAHPDASDFNPKFVLSYRAADNVLLAIQAAQGFRLGGPNDVVPTTCAEQLAFLGLTSAPLAFGPEKVRSFELNAKTSWFEDRFIANVAIYRLDYDDIQATQPLNRPTSCGFSFTANGGKASSRGLELELAGRVGGWFRWSAEGTWTDATLDEDLPSGTGKAGDTLPFSAPFTGSAYGRFTFPVGDMNSFVQLDYRYVGERVQQLGYQGSTTAAQPTPGYDTFNFQIGLARESWEADLFVDNVADDTSVLSGGQFDFDTRYVVKNRPRTVGISMTYRMK